LKFKPRFIEKIWGGRKFQTVLHKQLPSDKPIGESWEIYDFPPGVVDNSSGWVSAAVENGPLAGKTLHQLVEEYGPALHGDVPLVGGKQFPILIKFLDAKEDLSVQVHPTQAYADTHPGAHLKTEAWYVLQADPGSRILKDLQPGVTKDAFKKAIEDSTVESMIKAIPSKPGDCYFLPSGTVHALGAGILVAEVQTPSDTTFRVFDFNRLENGKPRKLHIQEALDVIDFSGKPAPPQKRSHVASYFTTVTRLVSSDYFTIEKVRFTEGVEEPVPYDQPVVWMMLEGECELRVDGVKETTKLSPGQTVLLPAQMRNPILKTLKDCVWLEVTFPTKK
jgi:mannose-6-phosphate isomerase